MHVAGDYGEIVMQGGGRQNRINQGNRRAVALHRAREDAPTVGDGGVYRQYASGEALSEIDVQPLLQLSASLPRRKVDNALPDFSQGKHAQIKRLLIGGVHPCDDARLGLDAHDFRYAIGIQKVAAHSVISRPGS